MTEQDQERPLTRRELRQREMGETGAMDLSEAQLDVPVTPAVVTSEESALDEIEISPLNDDGTPRSRREMRQLREEALAARAEAAGGTTSAETADAADTAGVPEYSVDVAAGTDDSVATEDTVATDAADASATPETPDEPEVAAPLTGEIDFDSVISPPTEPFTVDELREAEQNGDTAEETAAEAEAAAETPAASKPKRRFPWKRSRADEAEQDSALEAESAAPAAEPTERDEPAAEDAAATEVLAAVSDENAASDESAALDEPVLVDEAAVEPDAEGNAEPLPEVVLPAPDRAADLPVAEPVADEAPESAQSEPDAAEAPVPAPVGAKPSYSFPDIAPPEEWRSVFDDPSGRNLPTRESTGAEGDFDDLISRAVAQEGATGNTNTSALILPTMPEDTGGLTGPLGGTGELYVTGSLKLPKSLGETGGHSALHDSIEIDPITGAETDDPQLTGQGPAPVSARHAVSARMDSSIPVVAKPAKERSKLPLVLSLTGGGLLVAVVALGIWGASNGVFG